MRAALCLTALFLCLIGARAQDFPNCTEFGVNIPVICCCSNNCCEEAKAGEFRHEGGDNYRSVVTGQAVKRSGWSADGRTIKCACDFDMKTKAWVKHPKAFIRCLWLPMPSS